MCRLSWNLEASTSWNPQGLSRPVMGLLYLLRPYSLKVWNVLTVRVSSSNCRGITSPLFSTAAKRCRSRTTQKGFNEESRKGAGLHNVRAGPSGRAVWGVRLRPLACWDRGFESHRGRGCIVCCECCVLSGRGLCDELTTRPEESYRLWCVAVCYRNHLRGAKHQSIVIELTKISSLEGTSSR